MAEGSQNKATKAYRKRSKRKGLVRVEVQTPKEYSELIKSVAKALREDPGAAFEVKKAVAAKRTKRGARKPKPERSLLDLFNSLPDISGPEFDEVFNQPRTGGWRKIDL